MVILLTPLENPAKLQQLPLGNCSLAGPILDRWAYIFSIYLSTFYNLHIYLSIYILQSTYIYLSTFNNLHIYLFIFILFLSICFYLFVSIYLFLSILVSIYLCSYLSLFLSIFVSIYPCFYLSLYVSL